HHSLPTRRPSDLASLVMETGRPERPGRGRRQRALRAPCPMLLDPVPARLDAHRASPTPAIEKSLLRGSPATAKSLQRMEDPGAGGARLIPTGSAEPLEYRSRPALPQVAAPPGGAPRPRIG